MIEVRETEEFVRWLTSLRDKRLKGKIAARTDRLRFGNPGDVAPVGKGVSELRIDYGPGWRVYFASIDTEIALLLCGGDKSTQQKDIERALRWREWV